VWKCGSVVTLLWLSAMSTVKQSQSLSDPSSFEIVHKLPSSVGFYRFQRTRTGAFLSERFVFIM